MPVRRPEKACPRGALHSEVRQRGPGRASDLCPPLRGPLTGRQQRTGGSLADGALESRSSAPIPPGAGSTHLGPAGGETPRAPGNAKGRTQAAALRLLCIKPPPGELRGARAPG